LNITTFHFLIQDLFMEKSTVAFEDFGQFHQMVLGPAKNNSACFASSDDPNSCFLNAFS